MADHVKVAGAPVPTLVGLRATETTGGLDAPPLVAVTLVLALPVPPAFEQVSM